MPPGKTLFVVISRSLCECHINAQPRSLAGLAWVLEGCRVRASRGLIGGSAAVLTQACVPPPRRVASGPRYGVPPYHGAVGENVGIGQRCRAAAGHIAEGSHFERLVVVLAPLVIVDRVTGAGGVLFTVL